MSTDVSDLDRRLRRLRRRLVFERTLFSIALLAVAGALAYPRLFPAACTLSVGGRPLIAVADRPTAERVLRAAEEGVRGRRGEGVSGSGGEGVKGRGGDETNR